MDIIPPHDENAEKSVLGSILINPAVFSEVSEILSPEDFYMPGYAEVYLAMCELMAEGKAVDPVTLQSRLQEKGLPDTVSGSAFLTTCADAVPFSTNASQYARIVHDKAMWRRYKQIGKKVASDCYGANANLREILEKTEGEIQTLAHDLISLGGNVNVGSFSELIDAQIEKPSFAVPDLIPVGFTILAAPPKFGKSWLCLQLGIAMQRGEKFLGFQANRGDVVYLALEDSEYRLQDRLKKLGARPEDLQGFYYMLTMPDMDHGFLDELKRILLAKPQTRLIIIDTLQKIRGAAKRNDGAYQTDYREIGALQTFALKNKISIIAVHHTRKMTDPGDVFAGISGTNGISGAADAMLMLTRKNRMDKEATLSVTGRDLNAEEIEIRFDACRWIRLGLKAEIEEQRLREQYEAEPIVQTLRRYFAHSEEPWIGSGADFVKMARYYRISIHESGQALGKKMESLESMLLYNDGIEHVTLPNGTGGKRHQFSKNTLEWESLIS